MNGVGRTSLRSYKNENDACDLYFTEHRFLLVYAIETEILTYEPYLSYPSFKL